MKKWLLTIVALMAPVSLSYAQDTKSQLNTYNNAVVTTNGIGAITGATLNPLLGAIINASCTIADPTNCPLSALSGATANLPLIGAASGGGVAQGTRSGNTTIFGTISGTLTTGDCVSINSGNLVDAGGPCTTGGGGGTVTSGLANQLAYYPANGTTVGGTFDPNFPITGFWFQNNGANVTRLNDYVFIGGATQNDGNFPNVAKDWLTNYQISFGLGNGTCPVSVLCVLTPNNSSAGTGGVGILGGVRSFYLTSAGPTPLALAGFAIDDNQQWTGTGTISGTTFTVSTTTSGSVAIGQALATPSNQQVSITGGSAPTWTLASAPGNVVSPTSMITAWPASVWGAYTEAHRLSAAEGQVNGIEVDVRNLGGAVVPTPPTVGTAPLNSQMADGMISGCGAGLTSTGQTNCTNGLLIINNGLPPATNTAWENGILFGAGSVVQQPDNTIRAIVLPSSYGIHWFDSGGSDIGNIETSGGGVLELNATTGITVNGFAGANCSGTPTSSFATHFGIVTHC